MATEAPRINGPLRLVGENRLINDSDEKKEALMLCNTIISAWASRTSDNGMKTISELLVLESRLEAVFGMPIDGDEIPEIIRLLQDGEPMERILDWLRDADIRSRNQPINRL